MSKRQKGVQPPTGGLLTGAHAVAELKRRRSPYHFKNVVASDLDQHFADGWEHHHTFKRHITIRKKKANWQVFEDYVWQVLYEMQFTEMNGPDTLPLNYGASAGSSQKLDVIAKDDETILVVECKCAEAAATKATFKQSIEALGGQLGNLIAEIRKRYNAPNHKVRFIWATENYILTQPDKDRLTDYKIVHHDKGQFDYWFQLGKHLDGASKYQLLGSLFPGMTIPKLRNQVPAIRGQMGGHPYYMFSIEPETLLKFSYVLHRNDALREFMPTYQRIIKKARLRNIESFINNGGFFPNSIVINIEAARPPRFDRAANQGQDTEAQLGVLHLPKAYRSAYVIDGQHRLYGYANSPYRLTNTIPVVAFVGLTKKDQINLFMQINENQKSVSQNLRSTLRAELLWASDNPNEQLRALYSRIAQDLGEWKESPLSNRVVVGENSKDKKRCITLATIEDALKESPFTNRYSKVGATTHDGLLDVGLLADTHRRVMQYLVDCLGMIKSSCPVEWEKGDAVDGCLTTNGGIGSLIRVLGDVLAHVITVARINPKQVEVDVLVRKTQKYVDVLANFYNSIDGERRIALKRYYGAAGRIKYWRELQEVVHGNFSDFMPDGLQKYMNDKKRVYNVEGFKKTGDIEQFLNSDFRKRLEAHYGLDWMRKGLPKDVYSEIHKRAIDKTYDDEAGKEFGPWESLQLIDYKKIATHGSNWKDIFEAAYTMPGDEKKPGGKDGKTSWFVHLNKIRNENVHTYIISAEEYEFLSKIHHWLLQPEEDA